MRKREKAVAVVDDDPLMLGAIDRLLKARGFEVMTYESAEAFLDDEASKGAACLVLDISLGGISGLELGRRLLANGNRLPIIFITAIEGEWAHAEALAIGCLAYICKPFRASELIGAIVKAAETRAS